MYICVCVYVYILTSFSKYHINKKDVPLRVTIKGKIREGGGGWSP